MNKKANYKKGKRREIIKILYGCGCITYSSLRMLKGETRLYTRTVRKMRDEGIVDLIKVRTEKCITLRNYDENRLEYEPEMPNGYDEYYQQSGLPDKKRILNREESTSERAIRRMECFVQMKMSGVSVYPEEKKELYGYKRIEKNEVCYYTSLEIKRKGNYEDITAEENGEKKVIGSRLAGCLLSPGGVYGVYNVDDSLIEWRKYGELKMAHYIADILNNNYEPYIESNVSKVDFAVIMASDNRIYQEIIKGEYKNKDTYIKMNIDFTYPQMYAVPLDKNGQKMMSIMVMEKWREKLNESVLSEEEMIEAATCGIICDAKETTAEGKEIYKLLFCIPDLTRLKHFLVQTQLRPDKSKYQIYCFDYQLEMLAGLVGEYAEVYSMPIDEYLKEI